MRIAIIEDENQIRNGLSHLLEHIQPDHQIVGTASDGVEGLALIQKKLPDLVITDVRMPNMDGLEMIEAVAQAGLNVKFIIISAFSEFSYAKRAMSFGVTEYLLKPISITELTQALHKLESQIAADSLQLPHDSLEDAMKTAALQGYSMTEQDCQRLALRHGLTGEASFALLLFYYGAGYESRAEGSQRLIVQKFKTQCGAVCAVPMDGQNAVLYVLHGTDPPEVFFNWLSMGHKVYASNLWGGADVSLGFCQGLAAIYPACKGMLDALPWKMSFPGQPILRYPDVLKSQTVPCTFPVDIENQLRTAMCSRQLRKIGHTFDQFNLYFSGEKTYAPQEIRECYTRFLWTAVKLTKELNMLKSSQITLQRMLEQIFNAKNMPELHMISNTLLAKIGEAIGSDDQNEVNINVLRAKSLVREFYASGITLEEVAHKLNITPEYLSTQFRQEVGETFSSYVRNYRVAKAKELLLGTNLKLQQIARQVGYNDAKYFSQVFKKTTGLLPAEYRQSHK